MFLTLVCWGSVLHLCSSVRLHYDEKWLKRAFRERPPRIVRYSVRPCVYAWSSRFPSLSTVEVARWRRGRWFETLKCAGSSRLAIVRPQ
ncbi:hypothetical protein BDV32DRAFT_132785 [Aspergillus pseudonomiae]|nr:hypothetical protein BDV32DRAFT_132785 [Aspergillus pseudonomiae]